MSVFQSRTKTTPVLRAEGITVFTEDKAYLDSISGMFNMPFGYSCEPMQEAVSGALSTLPFHPKEHFYTPLILETAERILDACKMPKGSVLFLNGGSEGIEGAIAIALATHEAQGESERKRIVSRRHSYHGATLGAHSVTGRGDFKELRHQGYETIRINPPFPVQRGNHMAEAMTAKDVRQVIENSEPRTIAAFIMEPVNHLKGMHPCPASYVQEVREICDDFGILMITDEIVTGAYRTGPFLATHHADVLPDIAVLGKGLSGGYTPASAVVASEKIRRAFDKDLNNPWTPCVYSHTYAGNPVSIAAIAASLDLLESQDMQNNISELGKWMAGFAKDLSSNPKVQRAQSIGCLLGVTLALKTGLGSGKRVEQGCFEEGIVLRGEEDWFCLVPSFVTSRDEFNLIVERINYVVSSL